MFGLVGPDLILLGVFGLGTPELIIFAVIVLVLFGSRLPSAMKSLGMSVNSFKKGMKETEEDDSSGNIDSKTHDS